MLLDPAELRDYDVPAFSSVAPRIRYRLRAGASHELLTTVPAGQTPVAGYPEAPTTLSCAFGVTSS